MKKYIERLLVLSKVPKSEFEFYDEDIVECEFRWACDHLMKYPDTHDLFIDYYENKLTSKEISKKYNRRVKSKNDIDRILRRHNINYERAYMYGQNHLDFGVLMLSEIATNKLRMYFENLTELHEYMKATYCFSTQAFIPKQIDSLLNTYVHDDPFYERNVLVHGRYQVYGSTRDHIVERMCYLYPDLEDYRKLPDGIYMITRIFGACSLSHLYHSIPKPFSMTDHIPEELVYMLMSDVLSEFQYDVLTRRFTDHETYRDPGRTLGQNQYQAESAKHALRSGLNGQLLKNTLLYSNDPSPLNIVYSIFGRTDITKIDSNALRKFTNKLTADGYISDAQKIYKIHVTAALRDQLWKIIHDE